jgi:hypothetical protein
MNLTRENLQYTQIKHDIFEEACAFRVSSKKTFALYRCIIHVY